MGFLLPVSLYPLRGNWPRLNPTTAQILCRIPSDSPDIYRLGELLLDGTFEGLAFVFREEGYRTQRLIIPPETIENDLMAHRPFTVPKLRIHVTEKNATVFAGILLITGEQFELSGFPRQLVRGSRRFNRSKWKAC